MSTRSHIIARLGEGKWGVIYCHFDGYPRHHAPILTTHYKKLWKIRKLIELGGISSLDKWISCPRGHTFNNRIEGYTVAYGRDRQSYEMPAEYFSSQDEALAYSRENDFIEHRYVWRGKNWWHSTGTDRALFVKLVEGNTYA